MTKQEVSERFSGGHVKHMVTTHKAVQWLGRILGIEFVLPSLNGPHMIQVIACFVMHWSFACYGGYTGSMQCSYIFVKKALSSNRDRQIYVTISVVPLIQNDYYVYVPFESVVGFTPDWKELQAVNTHGGIYVVPLDLQLAPYKDKMRLQAAH